MRHNIGISRKIKENVPLLYLFVPARNFKKIIGVFVYVCVSNIERDYYNIISEKEIIIRVTILVRITEKHIKFSLLYMYKYQMT